MPTPRSHPSRCARLALALLLACSAGAASAQTPPPITVTDAGDSGMGTLRDALMSADQDQEIRFSLPAGTVITVLDPDPLVAEDDGLVINGGSATNLELAGDTASTIILQIDAMDVRMIDIDQRTGIVELGGNLIYETTEPTDLDVVLRNLGATPGSLTKEGDDTLTLTQDNTYTGGTTVNAGTLIVQAGASLAQSGAIAISSPATLLLETNAGDTVVFDGALTGDGVFRFDGEMSTLTLNTGPFDGTLEFAASTNGNTVQDTGNVLQGDVAFSNPADTLQILDDATLPGDLSGPGTLFLDPGANGGTFVTLRGNNSHASTHVQSGRLIGDTDSLTGTITTAAGTTVEISQNGSGSLGVGTVISGMADLVKTGSGTVTIDDDQTYSGTTTISGGDLRLAADLTGTTSVTVASGAVLSGNGMANAPLTVDGTVSPGVGNTLGQLDVASATFNAGSTFEAHVKDDGTGDLLNATGTLNASGATAKVFPTPGDYSMGSTITILHSGTANGLTAPTLDPEPFAFLTVVPNLTPGQMGTDYQVTVTGGLVGLAGFATNANQTAVANYLQTQFDAPPAAGSPVDLLGQELVVVPEGAVPGIYDAIGGESISAFTTAHLASAERFARSLHRRARGDSWGSLAALLGGSGTDTEPSAAAPAPLQYAGPVSAPAFDTAVNERDGFGLWLEPWGGFGELDGDGNAADVEYTLAGFTLGLDRRFGHFLLGGAAGYSYIDLQLSGQDTTSRAHGAQAALYGGWSDERGYVNGAARFSWARNDSKREIAIGMAPVQTAKADFDTTGYGVGAEAGLNVARLGSFVLQPVASFDWTLLDQESFDESGANAALSVDGETTDSLRSGVGLRVSGAFQMDEDSTFFPELRARWLHEFGDTDRVVNSRFVTEAVPTAGFRVQGAEAPRDTFLAGVGWSTVLQGHARIQIEYDALIDSDRLDHLFSVTARFAF